MNQMRTSGTPPGRSGRDALLAELRAAVRALLRAEEDRGGTSSALLEAIDAALDLLEAPADTSGKVRRLERSFDRSLRELRKRRLLRELAGNASNERRMREAIEGWIAAITEELGDGGESP